MSQITSFDKQKPIVANNFICNYSESLIDNQSLAYCCLVPQVNMLVNWLHISAYTSYILNIDI